MAKYVPRIFLCGDGEDFKKIVGDKPAQIVGQIIFKRLGDDVKIFFGEREIFGEDINRLLDGTADYLVFVSVEEFTLYLENFPRNEQVISAATFAKKFRGDFFSVQMFSALISLLNKKIFANVLDFDGLFAKSDLRTANDLRVELFGIDSGELCPIHENIYAKIFRTADDCRYKFFDAILLTAEREPEEFVDALIDLDSLSENILAFVRKNSALESWLETSQKIFSAVEIFPTANGAWCLLKKFARADVGIYIVTHKDVKLSDLPAGYKIIHAGHLNAKKNFGYAGDDTGENISALNKFLDEVTALYWIWKNTAHTHTGFVHYRRFLTVDDDKTFDAEKILSAQEILRLLKKYDMIAVTEKISDRTQRELMVFSTGSPELVDATEEIVRRHLIRTQPDYLDAFNAVMDSFIFFAYGIHITRRKIFDSYCSWLFSFIVDATLEMKNTITINGNKLEDMPHVYSRMASFFAERMLTVWLTKNHLRIKTLPIMYREDV